MPQLGRFTHTASSSTTGLPISGASVTLYKEGSTVNGAQAITTGQAVTVRHRGKIVATDNAFLNTTTGTLYAVDSVTATTITLSGFAGTLSLANGDRIIAATNTPSFYTDDQGGAAVSPTANILTTSSVGLAAAYVNTGAYDYIVSGSGLNTELYQGMVVSGEAPSVIYSGETDSASAVAHKLDTINAMSTSGSKLLSLLNNTTEKFYVDKDGKLGLNIGILGTLAVAGATTLSSTLAAGTTTITGTLTASDLTTAGALTAGTVSVSGAISLAATTITSTLLVGNAKTSLYRLYCDQGTSHVNGDWVLSAGWGSTATATVAASSKDNRFMVTILCQGSGIAANPTATLTFKNGTFTSAPFAVLNWSGGTGNVQTSPLWTTTATTLVVTHKDSVDNVPSSGDTYILGGIVIG